MTYEQFLEEGRQDYCDVCPRKCYNVCRSIGRGVYPKWWTPEDNNNHCDAIMRFYNVDVERLLARL